jgi:hypothetical protein
MFKELLRKIFNNTPEQDIQKEPEPSRKLDISEPVYRMVEVVKRCPSRIKVKHEDYSHNSIQYAYCNTNTYSVTDIKTCEVFAFMSNRLYCMGESETYYDIQHKIDFTQDEINYLVNEIKPLIDARIDRAERIKSMRQTREQEKARQELFDKLA